jgi:hypothetical protein
MDLPRSDRLVGAAVGCGTRDKYYRAVKEIAIVHKVGRSEYGTLIGGAGSGLCRTSENSVPAKFAEFTFQRLYGKAS